MLENYSTEKVTTRCLYCIMSLVLYKQKLSILQASLNLPCLEEFLSLAII